MRMILTAAGLAAGQFLWQFAGAHDWTVALDRAYTAAAAVATVWLLDVALRRIGLGSLFSRAG